MCVCVYLYVYFIYIFYSNTMYMLVRIGDYVLAHQSSGIHISFLSHQLAHSLILVKRLFDRFIVSITIWWVTYIAILYCDMSSMWSKNIKPNLFLCRTHLESKWRKRRFQRKVDVAFCRLFQNSRCVGNDVQTSSERKFWSIIIDLYTVVHVIHLCMLCIYYTVRGWRVAVPQSTRDWLSLPIFFKEAHAN